MSMSVIERLVEVSSSMLGEEVVTLQDKIIPDKLPEPLDHRPGEHEIVHDTAPKATKPERLTEKKQHRESLEGKDAALFRRLSSVPAPIEKPIEIPLLLSKLSSLLPRGRQLERRARKLAWQLLKGRKVTSEWDNVVFSELTAAENRMSDDDFLTLYSDQVKTPAKKGGRPRKYRTAKAQKRGHADRQRRYRERKPLMISDVMKTSLQIAER
jgi:hypothetical protein